MQLTPAEGAPSVRVALRAAACLLLASACAPDSARAEGEPHWQLEGSGLLYGELQRTQVAEPMFRVTRLLARGQALSAQVDFDVITGASPSGAAPSGRVQTVTTASGETRTIAADELPTTEFEDTRGALDLEWVAPVGRSLTATTGGHVSRESDYRSLGARGQLALEAFQRLSTFTAGASVNRDVVEPVGGIVAGLTDGSLAGPASSDRRSSSLLLGTSRVMTRRWLLGVTGTWTAEEGYLSDPYKVVSLVGAVDGLTTGELREKRPASRLRRDVLASSVYHHSDDVSYATYRYYWDDWGIRSHTIDLKLRHDLDETHFLQPHVRAYSQSAASFHRYALRAGDPLPAYASADYRLGDLRTVTLGTTWGFDLAGLPGLFTVRAEYLRQWGKGTPTDAVGVQKQYDHAPAVHIGTLMVGWSVAI